MKKIKLTALLIVALFITSCTHTKVVSFTDPDANGKLYNHIAVIANVDDLSDRLAIESKMVKTLDDKGVTSVSSLILFPPTREFTVEQEYEVFKNNKVEALAVIEISDTGFHVSPAPINIHTETKKDDDKEVTGTTVSIGETERKAFGQLRVSLIDVDSDKTMWIGDVDAQSFFDTDNPDWDMEYLLKASSKKIAKELIKTGLIRINK